MTGPESTDPYLTAPSQLVEATDIRFAYRHLGDKMGTPLVFLQHPRGGTGYWDSTVTDGPARHRPVVLFDNAGVAASIGETSGTIGMETTAGGDRPVDQPRARKLGQRGGARS